MTSAMSTTICYAVRYSEKGVKKYINVKFWKRPSTIQLEQLFKQNDYNNVLQLSLFVKVIIAKFWSVLNNE